MSTAPQARPQEQDEPLPTISAAQAAAAQASRPMSPHGPQAPVPIQRQIDEVDSQIYQLARKLEKQISGEWQGNTLDTKARLQRLRAARATLKAVQQAAPATATDHS